MKGAFRNAKLNAFLRWGNFDGVTPAEEELNERATAAARVEVSPRALQRPTVHGKSKIATAILLVLCSENVLGPCALGGKHSLKQSPFTVVLQA